MTGTQTITNESTPSEPQPEPDPIEAIHQGECPSLSGRSTLTYAIGRHPDGTLHFRLVSNDGGGMFCDEWIPGSDIDAIVIGAAGAMTAPRRFRGFAAGAWREGKSVDHLLSQLDEIVGVIGLLFVAAYFRPAGAAGWASAAVLAATLAATFEATGGTRTADASCMASSCDL
jgi:hypothetical protein